MDFLLELDAPPPPRAKPAPPPPAPAASSLFELDAPVAPALAPAAPAPNPLFELDAPAPAAKHAAAPAAGTRSTAEFMSELDAPPAAEAGHRADNRSTAEFMFDVDAATSGTSREIDLDAEAEVAAAVAPAAAQQEPNAPTLASEPASPTPVPPAVITAVDLSPFQADAAHDQPKTAEAQHEQRVQRAAQRILACRDGFRLLGFLGIQEDDRKTVARMLKEIDHGFSGSGEGAPSAIKDPEAALQSATREQLDALERLLNPIEDKLLYLDEAVAPDDFRQRILASKQSKKLMARYARMLASRRFMAGTRRDRFEWILTYLLTATDASGMRKVMPPDRARGVLQHVLGGLQRKGNERERSEAIAYLQDALVRLANVPSQEEFFDGGLFIDVHGYKVSMRDQLLLPEFAYLSVLVDAQVHNRLEGWIADRERLHRGNQLTAEGSPREQIMRRVRDAEDAVDDLFSVKRRAQTQTRTEAAKPAAPAKKNSKEKSSSRRRFLPEIDIVVDRQLVLLAGSLLVIAVAATYIAFQVGAVGVPEVRVVQAEEAAQLSSLLARCWIRGSGSSSLLDATIRESAWHALDGRRRQQEAEHLAKALASRKIPSAVVKDNRGGKVITVEKGFATYVQGGKI